MLASSQKIKSTPIDTFKHFYERFGLNSLDQLGDIYADDIVFSDPVHEIRGLDELTCYFKQMCGNLNYCRFEFVDEMVMESRACFTWHMHYSHPSLKGDKVLILKGISLITYSDKINSHEDFYDMGAMLYEHLPLLGSAIRLIKSRLEKETKN